MSNAGPDCQAQTAVKLCQAQTVSMEVWFTFQNQFNCGLNGDWIGQFYSTSQLVDLEAVTLRDICEGRKLS